MSAVLTCGRFKLSLERPLVMGIVNVTPDSFSDGAQHFGAREAIEHARRLVTQGADILDIGGESTRPGAQAVSADEELARIMPVLEGVKDWGVPISIDTCKPAVMATVLAAGADMINDINGFRADGAVKAVAASSTCGVCVMHMQGEPRTMQAHPVYRDVVSEVKAFLADRAQALRGGGVTLGRIVLDPGFGFGKTLEHNYRLLHDLQALRVDDYPILLGVSRKSMIGKITGRATDQRLGGSVAAALAGVVRGAQIIRVHDVADTVDALKIWSIIEQGVRA
ncbi:dihydropteroate synthase [Alcaligenaceae bacterium CGII-47]|nr:dihydropteroate synthase [Alcaligenaceae bacterium CGII-47]